MQRFRVGKLLFEKNNSVFSCLYLSKKSVLVRRFRVVLSIFRFFVEFSSNLSVFVRRFRVKLPCFWFVVNVCNLFDFLEKSGIFVENVRRFRVGITVFCSSVFVWKKLRNNFFFLKKIGFFSKKSMFSKKVCFSGVLPQKLSKNCRISIFPQFWTCLSKKIWKMIIFQMLKNFFF